MKAFVGVTDGDWYTFLSTRPDIDEVNFWQPSGGRRFRSLDIGDPFLFKLHHPENYIAGGGFFGRFVQAPSRLAWDAFGEKNGAPSYDAMRAHIEKYRRESLAPHDDYTIGCILLQQPFFLDRADWIPAPADFKKNIVQGKGYDLSSDVGRELWEAVQAKLTVAHAVTAGEPAPMYGDPVLVKQRLGQGTFRLAVTDIYEKRCAVTGEKVLPVLEAAHIQPVSVGGMHSVDNGILLRSDVHTLFDQGYVTVTPNFEVRVSSRLRDEFHNGKHYYRFEGRAIWLPKTEAERPNREFLEWHGDSVFRG